MPAFPHPFFGHFTSPTLNSYPQQRRTPGPKASLTESEVITLIIFSQWARVRSERDFYRYAASRLRPAFPPSRGAASSTG